MKPIVIQNCLVRVILLLKLGRRSSNNLKKFSQYLFNLDNKITLLSTNLQNNISSIFQYRASSLALEADLIP